jgi:F-box-like
VAIDVLPDDALLEIFRHCGEDDDDDTYLYSWMWKPLVHVCKRWRRIIFASPKYLQLVLLCNGRTLLTESLDLWPLLPIMISFSSTDMGDQENVIVAFQHRDRIIDIEFSDITTSMLETISTFLEKPLPDLTQLTLWGGELELILPETFLGGSAPRLRHISLSRIAFPTLPTLLTSTRQLVTLHLDDIPDSGYVSAEAMATCLATSPNLERFHFEFQSPMGRMSHPDVKSPPLTRADLPALTEIEFRGHSEYLEDLLARIDAPFLCNLEVNLTPGPIVYMSQLYRFIARIEEFNKFHRAVVELDPWSVILDEFQHRLHLRSSSGTLGSQISFIARVLDSRVHRVESLSIYGGLKYGVISGGIESQGDMGQWQWLDLFSPFVAMERLFVSENVVPAVARVLRGVPEERAAEVLPALRRLTLGGPDWTGSLREAIEPFPTARQLSGSPVFLR